MTTKDNIISRFPHPQLSNPITEMPTYLTIRNLHVQLSANVASISSPLGNGKLGLLGITLSKDAYKSLSSNVEFKVPKKPDPIDIPEKATAVQIAAAKQQYDTDLLTFNECANTDLALKSALLQDVPDIYTRTVKDGMAGYAHITTKSIIDHLYKTYGQIYPSALAANEVKLRQPFIPEEPIEAFFERIEDTRDFADAGETAYSDAYLVAAVANAFLQTNRYNYACREWKRVSNQTYKKLKTHFTQAHNELAELPATSGSEGFASAALENLAQTTQDTLTSFASSVQNNNTTISTLQQAITNLQQQLTGLNNGGRNNRSNNANRRGGQAAGDLTSSPTAQRNNNRPTRPTDRYCWTHGFKCGRQHTSRTCHTGSQGHQRMATATNRMGGSTDGFIPGYVPSPANSIPTNNQRNVSFNIPPPAISAKNTGTITSDINSTPSADDTTVSELPPF